MLLLSVNVYFAMSPAFVGAVSSLTDVIVTVVGKPSEAVKSKSAAVSILQFAKVVSTIVFTFAINVTGARYP